MQSSRWETRHAITGHRLRSYFATPWRQLELRVTALLVVSTLLVRTHSVWWVLTTAAFVAAEVFWYRHRRRTQRHLADSNTSR